MVKNEKLINVNRPLNIEVKTATVGLTVSILGTLKRHADGSI